MNPFGFIYMLFATLPGCGLLIVFFILAALLPFLSYGMIFKYIGLFLLLAVLLGFYHFVYTHLKGDLFGYGEIGISDLFKSFLKLLLSPLSWLGFFGWLTIGVFSMKLFWIVNLYLIALFVYDIYENRDDIKRTKKRADIIVSRKVCDVCQQKVMNQTYQEKRLHKNSVEYGLVCASCMSKYSPFLQKPLSTLADVKEHLAYREKNLAQPFTTRWKSHTPQWKNRYLHKAHRTNDYGPEILIDTEGRTMKIGGRSDIFNLDDVLAVEGYVEKDEESYVKYITEEDYRDVETGRIDDKDLYYAIKDAGSYEFVDDLRPMKNLDYGLLNTTPEHRVNYKKTYYDFYVKFTVNHPYISDISVKLNTDPIYQNTPKKVYDAYVSTMQKIVATLKEKKKNT